MPVVHWKCPQGCSQDAWQLFGKGFRAIQDAVIQQIKTNQTGINALLFGHSFHIQHKFVNSTQLVIERRRVVSGGWIFFSSAYFVGGVVA